MLVICSSALALLQICVENESSVFYDALPLLYKEVKQFGSFVSVPLCQRKWVKKPSNYMYHIHIVVEGTYYTCSG